MNSTDWKLLYLHDGQGYLYIRRLHYPVPSEQAWKDSQFPLLPLQATTSGGIESDKEAVHLGISLTSFPPYLTQT